MISDLLSQFTIFWFSAPSAQEEAAHKNFIAHRNDSYADAIEGDPVVEEKYKVIKLQILVNLETNFFFQETHFPYNPSMASIGSLECDKFPQEWNQSKIFTVWSWNCLIIISITFFYCCRNIW